jgi:hypothetical protein
MHEELSLGLGLLDFCCLAAIELGLKPIVIERGKTYVVVVT